LVDPGAATASTDPAATPATVNIRRISIRPGKNTLPVPETEHDHCALRWAHAESSDRASVEDGATWIATSPYEDWPPIALLHAVPVTA
jgi:hypothetical protein